jgi:signal transduction histidine kinase
VLVGAGAFFLMVRHARERAEINGARHAMFVTQSVLAPALADLDLSTPLTGSSYALADDIVHDLVLSDGQTVRVKIWRLDGTIVYSDEPELVGMRFAEEESELEEVAEGHIEAGVSDLAAEENVLERELADKLFFTYAPLRTGPGEEPSAVAELYQDYAFIQDEIDEVVRRIAIIVALALALLYGLLLPIALKASKELRRRNERLNELLQREQETVAELRDLHQKKDDFVAAASHELRTPLTSIIGSLATLRNPSLGGDPAVRAEFIDAAEGQTRRLMRLITNLLSAAHLEDGKRPLTIERVDLAAVTRAVVAEVPGAATRVTIDIPPGRPVETDRGRIGEILLNLIDNALKYSPAGSPIEVGAVIGPEGFRVWVTDRGVGIDPDHQEAIFERFHQLDQSATRRVGGVGLGLHLSRGLVDDLGGRIEVTSHPGQGSTFTVVVPTGVAPHAEGRRERHATAPAG